MGYETTVKQWFKTGLKPTQAQFWAKLSFLRWKDEKISIVDIEDIQEILNAKAETAILTNHLTDKNAHEKEFSKKEDKSQKGVIGGYAPLDEFGRVSIGFLKYVNDLITGGEDSLLTAEQGKILQEQIDAINLLLTSDDINLDTIQEIVDAIKGVEISLSTILVNDLTTGGTMKALTAEMGKILKALIDALTANKVDKVAGERLINAGEITKLAGIETGAQVNVDVSGKQDIDNQIFVSVSGMVQDSWHGKIVTFIATTIQTVPSSGLRDGFKFDGIVDPTFILNTAITAPKAWFGGYTGASIPENSIFTFVQRKGDANKVSIYGL